MSSLDDPRVLFAAERTLLAWTRTSLTLMALGFAVERFGLFVKMMRPEVQPPHAGAGFAIGIALIFLGTTVSILSVVQYKRIVDTLGPKKTRSRYWVWMAAALN